MADQDRSSGRAPADPEVAPSPEGMQRAFSSRSEDDESVAQMLFILDRQDENPGIERLRRWALEQLAIAPGETVVDVGSGSGTMTRRLATLVAPGGRAVGVEPNPALRAVATERSTGEASAEFLDGLAGHLPFDDGTVDVVWCERVLQHLDDAAGAVREIARVLRPGGRSALIDADHATRIVAGIRPETEAAMRAFFLGLSPNARSAREIPAQAVAAGLDIDSDIGSSALIFPLDGVLVRGFVGAIGPRAVEEGAVTADEMAVALAALDADGAAGQAFSSVSVFGFVVRKPAV